MTVDDFPAKEHIRRLVHHFARLAPAGEHVVLLQGEHVLSRHDTDRELPFREFPFFPLCSMLMSCSIDQEANFHYATGCLVPSSTLIIRFTANETPCPEFEAKLCIPEADAESSMWSVPPPDLKEAERMFDFDATELGFTGKDDQAWFTALLNRPGDKLVHVLATASEGGYPVPSPWIIEKLASLSTSTNVTADHLQKAFHHARLIKTPQEISYIREACRITSGAHEIVMRELGKFAATREGKAAQAGKRDGKEALSEWEIESEGDAEAVFVAACRRAG
jgi:Xaa-Pro dipeptidase